jgi:hypothetical protein
MNVAKGASRDVCGVLSIFGEVFLSIATSAAVAVGEYGDRSLRGLYLYLAAEAKSVSNPD